MVSSRVQTLPASPSVTFVQLAAPGLARSKGPRCARAELIAYAPFSCCLLVVGWGLCSPVTGESDSGELPGAFTLMVSWAG